LGAAATAPARTRVSAKLERTAKSQGRDEAAHRGGMKEVACELVEWTGAARAGRVGQMHDMRGWKHHALLDQQRVAQ